MNHPPQTLLWGPCLTPSVPTIPVANGQAPEGGLCWEGLVSNPPTGQPGTDSRFVHARLPHPGCQWALGLLQGHG